MNKIPSGLTLQPKFKEELRDLIESEIKKNGNQCDLNHIDVSLITDLSFLFHRSKFDGNISGWNTSNAKNIQALFYKSKFNGDISGWDVSSAESINWMFAESIFYGDISAWSLCSVIYDDEVFAGSEIAKNLGLEDPNIKQVKSYFLGLKLEAGLQEASAVPTKEPKVRL